MLLAIVLLPTGIQTASAAGSGTHIPAAQYGAQLAPEPFCSHWQQCIGAMVPDQMRDQPLGHENHRAAGLLYTLEAIRYLRAGQTAKGLLTASIRVHYLTDSIAIAHSDVWFPRHESDALQPGRPGARVWSFLPQSLQDYWLPFDPLEPGIHYHRLRIDAPPLQTSGWEAIGKRNLDRNMHAFFDVTDIHKGHEPGTFPLGNIPDTTNWSAYDYEIFARWRSDQIALEVLDRASACDGDDTVRFAEAPRMQAAMDHEMENMIAAVQAYYRYLTVARDTHIDGDLDRLLPGHDRLALMARHSPAIHLSESAPWPLRRACSLLAMELVRAGHRTRGDLGASYADGLEQKVNAMIRPLPMPPGEQGRRVVLSWGQTPEESRAAAARPLSGNTIVVGPVPGAKGHMVLRGEDLQSTIHLVDYTLDLTHAPFIGRAPMEAILTAFRLEWAGLPLIDAIRRSGDAALPSLVRAIQNPHRHDQQEWAETVRGLVRPHARGADINLCGVIPRFYNYMLLTLPLPTGKRIDLAKL